VAEAHSHGLPVILGVGSEGEGEDFVGAANADNRGKFVREIVDAVVEFDYDGASIDWEENVIGNEQQLIALTRELRTALDAESPSLILMLDVISDLVPPWIAVEVVDDVDTVNLMSYWDDGLDQVAAYTSAGVPPDKIILGVGLSSDYYDLTAERVEQKVETVHERGLLGLESWAFHDIGSWSDARRAPRRGAIQ
jgi:hypothetical protein